MKSCKRWTTMSLGVILLAMSLGGSAAIAEIDVKRLSTPKPLPDFSLKDDAGKPFDKKNFNGRWSIILIGYTHCPDICPFTLQNTALVFEELKGMLTPGNLPQVVFLSVDPDRDAKDLGSYVEHFDPTFVGVTGDPKGLKTLVEGLSGYYRLDKKSEDDDAYEVRHSAQINIINPDAEIAATFNPPMEPVESARFIAQLMRDYRIQQTN